MAHFLYTLDVDALFTDNPDQFPRRSEERRVGKECRCRWSAYP